MGKNLEETEVTSESRRVMFRTQDRGNQLRISNSVVLEEVGRNKCQNQALDNTELEVDN